MTSSGGATSGRSWEPPGPGAWTFDAAHNAGPVTPVLQSVQPAAMEAGFRSFTGRYGLPISHIELRYVHGFGYGSVRIAGVPATDRPPPPAALMKVLTRVHPEMRRRERAARAASAQRVWRQDLDRWFDELRPARLDAVRGLQAERPDLLDDAALAQHLDRAIALLAGGLREHFSLVGAAGLPVGLHLLREQERGRSTAEALQDLRGAAAGSTGATVPALCRVAAALASAGVVPDDLDQVHAASPVASAALEAYLDDYGQRIVGAFDVTGRRLIEMPEVILRSILASGGRTPVTCPTPPRSGDPLLEDALLALASRDDHAGLSCMWPLGLLRRALLAVGERLHRGGRVHETEHALDAEPDELRGLLRGATSPGATELARRSGRRHGDAMLVPPPVLGPEHPPPDPSVFPPGLRRTTEAMGAFLATLEGTAGAAGGSSAVGVGDRPYRGRAVVAERPEQALERLMPGDVLVTTTTTPAFNCVLPIAGALVTAHGGAMSHAGIAARELGLPAVLGAHDVLERIPDGADVVVDPVAATVVPAPPHVLFGPGVVTSPQPASRVGGKAAGLISMASSGLPVPPGVVIPVGACPEDLEVIVREAVAELEQLVGRRLGDPVAPLLVSVRSGAAVSMPGMMDTLLDVGITDDVVEGLARSTRDPDFAQDTRRRFEQGWTAVIGEPIPEDPVEQVVAAARAVLASWDSPPAVSFREREGADDLGGTAVTIQAMVFGNLGDDSATGVVFSRDPSTGDPEPVGDVIVGAQGADVVDGTHPTQPLAALGRWPAVQRQLLDAVATLERHHADMVDVEFTVERGRLFLLQCRAGRRTDAAALRIAVDMAQDPSIPLDRAGAVARCRHLLDEAVHPEHPAHLGDPASLDDGSAAGPEEVLARGLAVSPGRGTGVLVVSVDDALRRHDAGQPVVLARPATSPADVAAMAVASGIVTTSGGMLSHAAVVARSWGLPAVVGASELEITEQGVRAGGRSARVGQVVTVDGSAGTLLSGAHAGEVSQVPELEVLRSWARELDHASAEAAAAHEHEQATTGLAPPEEAIVRVVVLRHRTDVPGIVAATGLAPAEVDTSIDRLVAAGHLDRAGPWLSSTDRARAHVEARTAALADGHGAAFVVLLDRFRVPDSALKAIVTDWQLRGPDDTDSWTTELLHRRLLDEVHGPVTPVVVDAAALAGHLQRYLPRLEGALAAISAGDADHLAHPSVDSYHGVWFELHEELIVLSGSTRPGHAAED